MRALSHRRAWLRLAGVLLLAACSTAKVTQSAPAGPTPALRPAVVWVSDFELQAAAIKSESGPLGLRPGILPQGPLGIVGRPNPEVEARRITNLMAETLVNDLTEAELATQRVPAGVIPAAEGWLVRGTFLQVDEGNRLRRAVIGFGAGATSMQLAVAIDDLARGAPAPFYELDTSAQSHPLPGAVVKLNPYVVAARFVLAGQDLDKNVKDTAHEIAKSVVARVNAPPGAQRP
jgi:hypothetical protein